MATIPSIAVIPSGYKASKLYSVLPTDGSGDLDVVRAGLPPNFNATRVNSEGLIENVLSNVPRLDYSDGGCPSLLVEPQRTNLLLRSEEFDDVYWDKQASTITQNAIISPNNTLTMDKLVSDVSGVNPRAQKSLTFLDNTNYTFSIFVKPSEWGYVVLTLRDKNLSTDRNAWFNINTGEFETVSGSLTARVLDSFSDNSYRISVTINSLTGATSPIVRVIATNADNTFTTGDGTSGIYIWGAQLEVGSNATSYIPTVASTVTRNADVISKTGISDLIGQTEGTFYAEIASFSSTIVGDTRFITLSDNTSNNFIGIGFISSGTNLLIVGCIANSVSNFNSYAVSNITNFNKIAITYNSTNFKIFINGVLTANLSGVVFSNTLTHFLFNAPSGLNPYLGKVKNTQVYKTVISEGEAITLTTL